MCAALLTLGKCLSQLAVLARADTGTEAAIPLPNVSAKILSKVIEYCKFHVAAEKKVDDKPAKGEEEVKNYDTEFVKVDQGTLFELILVRARARIACCVRCAPCVSGGTHCCESGNTVVLLNSEGGRGVLAYTVYTIHMEGLSCCLATPVCPKKCSEGMAMGL